MRDFTLHIYEKMLAALLKASYAICTVERFCSGKVISEKKAILRHDVDKNPANALRMARLESENGISGTYYFRMVSGSFDPEIIREIYALGHEIGYHYEDLAACRGDLHRAIAAFEINLSRLRSICPVVTISMHGSPWSKYDNRDLWKTYDYSSSGIIAEAYLDIDYNTFLYLTDTGRTWGDTRANLRDKVQTGLFADIRTTASLIKAIEEHAISDKIALTIHPQRWHNELIAGWMEWSSQQLKNIVKPLINSLR